MCIYLCSCVSLYLHPMRALGENLVQVLSIPAWGRVGMMSPDGWGGCLQIDSACNHSGGPVVGGRAQLRAPCACLVCKKLERGVCARVLWRVGAAHHHRHPGWGVVGKSVSSQIKEEGGRCCSCAMLRTWARSWEDQSCRVGELLRRKVFNLFILSARLCFCLLFVFVFLFLSSFSLLLVFFCLFVLPAPFFLPRAFKPCLSSPALSDKHGNTNLTSASCKKFYRTRILPRFSNLYLSIVAVRWRRHENVNYHWGGGEVLTMATFSSDSLYPAKIRFKKNASSFSFLFNEAIKKHWVTPGWGAWSLT